MVVGGAGDAHDVVARVGRLERQARVAALPVVQGQLPPLGVEDAQQALQPAALGLGGQGGADPVAGAQVDPVQVGRARVSQEAGGPGRAERGEAQRDGRRQRVTIAKTWR